MTEPESTLMVAADNKVTTTVPARAIVRDAIVYVIDGKEAFKIDVEYDLTRVPPAWHANVVSMIEATAGKRIFVHESIVDAIEGRPSRRAPSPGKSWLAELLAHAYSIVYGS